MNNGILAQGFNQPQLPLGLLGRPTAVPTPVAQPTFDPRTLPGLVAYWPFDEDAAFTNALALDASGNGFHLTSFGALSVPGRTGAGRRTSATGTQWNPSPARLSRGAWNATPQWDASVSGWSVAFWLLTDLTTATQGTGSTAATIVFSTITTAGAEVPRFASGTPALGFSSISSRCYFTDNSFIGYQTGVNLTGGLASIAPQDQWTHIAFVADPISRTFTMYVNGIPRPPVTFAADKVLSSFSSGLPCTINWPGTVDEIVVYNRALTLPEVQRLAGVPLAPVAASTLHPECLSWISRALGGGGTVTPTTVSAINAFCNAIDAAGIRDKFYRLNLFCGGNLSSCLVPLYRGQSLTGTQFGNAADTNNSFVAGDYVETGSTGGLLGNGTSKFLQTGFAPNTLAASSMHLSGYVVTANSTGFAAAVMGQFTSGGGGTELSLRHREQNIIGNAFYAQFNDVNSFVSGPAGNPTGHLIGTNVALNDKRFYQNGAQSGTTDVQVATSALASTEILIFAVNDATTGANAAFRSNARLAAYSIGAGLTGPQAAAYYTAMQTFQTALNRNV